MAKDPMGDRMKAYENQESFPETLDSSLPFYVRLDGRSFSKLTKKMVKPFDNKFTSIMDVIASSIFNEFNPTLVYVQSDEISIGWKTAPINEGQNSRYDFSGRRTKILTLLSGFASSIISKEFETAYPHFDARGYQPPSDIELANSFLWRMYDCKRNSINSIGQSLYFQKHLSGISQEKLIELLSGEYQNHSSRNKFGLLISKNNSISQEFAFNDVYKLLLTE
jgi:tRNA(His) 5'-end guanylyltransferase